jgi:hypothetical protein
MEILFFILTVWIIIWMFSNTPDLPNKAMRNMGVNLYVEKIDLDGKNSLLVYKEETHEFVCQAITEKELHTKLFEIYNGQPIDLRYDDDKRVRLTFEVFEKQPQ